MRGGSDFCSIGVFPAYELFVRADLEYHIGSVYRLDSDHSSDWHHLDHGTLKSQYVDGALSQMLRNYLLLTKPGIILGNLISVASGFFLASQGHIDIGLLLAALCGTALVIASGCVYNNYIDRDIDGKMERTRNRVMVLGLVPVKAAIIYATVLGLSGFAILLLGANQLAFTFGLLGFVVYVVLYSLRYKRTSVHGTLIGSLSGACPPVIGYCAVTNVFDVGAAILLVTFCLWQIPHSYAIAIYRFNDYVAANIPVLPVKQGIKAARNHMAAYIVAFTLVALMLSQQGYAGSVYAVAVALLGLYWLYIALAGYKRHSHQVWAKKLFVFSIVIITSFSVLISVDFVAPQAELVNLSTGSIR